MGQTKWINKEKKRALYAQYHREWCMNASEAEQEAYEDQPYDPSPPPVLFEYLVFIDGKFCQRFHYFQRKEAANILNFSRSIGKPFKVTMKLNLVKDTWIW